MAIAELGELFGKDIEDDEVDTAGGLLAKHLGKIPAVGNSVTVNGILLVAQRIEGSPNRVSHLIASAIEPAENGSTAFTTPIEQQYRSDHE